MIKNMSNLMRFFAKRDGLAQIPLMIGLLLMAVAVPAVTKLVQQNQDNRNMAAGCVGPGGTVGYGMGCCAGLEKKGCKGSGSYATCTCEAKAVNPTTPPSTRTCTYRHCVGLTCKSETYKVDYSSNCDKINDCVTDASCGAAATGAVVRSSATPKPQNTPAPSNGCSATKPCGSGYACVLSSGECVPTNTSCNTNPTGTCSGGTWKCLTNASGSASWSCVIPTAVPTDTCYCDMSSNKTFGVFSKGCGFKAGLSCNNITPTVVPTAKVGCTCGANGYYYREPGAVQCSDFQVNKPCIAMTPTPTTAPKVGCTCGANGYYYREPGAVQCSDFQVNRPCKPITNACTSNGCPSLGSIETCYYNIPNYLVQAGTKKCEVKNSGSSTACLAWSSCSKDVVPTTTPIKPTNTPTSSSCLANGRTTSSAGGCCSGYASYQNSQLTCGVAPTSAACLANGRTTSSAGSCCSGTASYTNAQLTCVARICLDAGRIASSASDCCTGKATYQGGSLTCSSGPTLVATRVPTPTTPKVTVAPTGGCTCVNGKRTGSGCSSFEYGQSCQTPTSSGPTTAPKCANCRTLPIGNREKDDFNCVYNEKGVAVCVPNGQVACTPGETSIQASLLGCPSGTTRICNCVTSGNWSCFCDADGNGTKSCLDNLNGVKATRSDGSTVWVHLNDEASAKCLCGDKYHQNSNGKWFCGLGDSSGGNGGNGGGTGISCTASSAKPADVCQPNMLSVNAACLGGKWDYDQQLCNSAGRKQTCGGQQYCCPSAGGSWTTDMTKCPAVSCANECPTTFSCYRNGSEFRWFAPGYVQTGFVAYVPENVAEPCGGVPKPSFLGKSKGDANCDGSIDVTDYSLWHKEFFDGNKGATSSSSWNADFTGSGGKCDGVVDVYDFSLWQKYFNEFNNQ